MGLLECRTQGYRGQVLVGSEAQEDGTCRKLGLLGDSDVVPFWLERIFSLRIIIYYPKWNYIGVFRYGPLHKERGR